MEMARTSSPKGLQSMLQKCVCRQVRTLRLLSPQVTISDSNPFLRLPKVKQLERGCGLPKSLTGASKSSVSSRPTAPAWIRGKRGVCQSWGESGDSTPVIFIKRIFKKF